ncbi:MAG TPA: DNA methyltransferase [Galbitalea sp.]|jgi:hypothetical protein
MNGYDEFLREKVNFDQHYGFEIDDSEINPLLFPHQRDIVRWAVYGGRRALFESFGLGKSVQQVEIVRICAAHERGYGLIVCPLGVRQEFMRDAALLGVEAKFIRTAEEMNGPGLYLTNYESIRDGKLDPNLFDAVSLDEASILRSFGSKTYQTFLPLFSEVKFRFVATATPSPNRYKELIHYAGFLGVMDTGQALTRFFQRDSTQANNLTLYPHKVREFWLWLNSWSIFLQKPSDLGYSDEGYDLPEIEVVFHEVAVDHSHANVDRDGQAQMFRGGALSIIDAAKEKRDTIDLRVAKAAELVAESPEDHFILWHDLEDERRALEDAFPTDSYNNWLAFKDGNARALELYERHYSAYQYADGRERKLFMGPGEKTVLLTRDGSALFGWRKFRDDSGQTGINCSVFRNEGGLLSSDLIREAMAIAWQRWPGERLYTYVNSDRIASENPGYCFKQAGWSSAGKTKGGLHILAATPDVDVPEVQKRVEMSSIFGSLDLDTREQRIIDFSDGKSRILATKPELSGSGCNFQRHCHRAIFVGVGFKFNDFIQAIHRIQRFQQTEVVRIDIIHAESESEVVATLLEKWEQHRELTASMTEIIREHGLNKTNITDALARSMGVDRIEASGEGWTLVNNDCVVETKAMDENSVDLIVTSIPFSNHYEYTPSYNDFGHTDNNDHFWAQMDHLTPELLRVLAPGRIYACHVKDRILFGSVTGAGVPTSSPFHAEAINHGIKHGFDYMGMITVVTDVVRENNQTYRLGWSENAKDGTKMGVGSPEYIILFHKPQSDRTKGYADIPVVKSKRDYTRAHWQVDAHSFWRSSGERHFTPDELAQLPGDQMSRLFTEQTLREVYDYESHIKIGEELEGRGALPATFMSLAPGSHHPDVWHDVNRMLTLNGEQKRRNLMMHVCPLQFDIVDRLIGRFSNEGDLVYDPFGGLGTVPLRAVKMGRKGRSTELNSGYFLDSVKYLEAEERKQVMPTLFDLDDSEREAS